MDLSRIIVPAQCLADQRFGDKAACLGDLSRRAAAALGLPAEEILQALRHRESLGSTGLGKGIALPHARLAIFSAPFVLVTRLREPIGFDAIDEKPVDIVCLVLLPASGATEPLNVLAAITRRLRDDKVLAAIRKAKTGETLHGILTTA